MPNAADSLTIAERVVLLARGSDQAQATVSSNRAAYSRFARNYVTQNLNADSTTVTLTYVRNGHLGTATTGNISQSGLHRLVASAADIAKRVPKNREFVSLAKRAPIAKAIKSVYASTRDATPDDRVNKLLPVFARMKQSNLSSAGFTTTQTSVTAVANSLGVRVAFEGTYGGIEIKAMAANTSGFAEYFSRDYASLDSAERAQRASAKATVSSTPEDFAPGTYTVILEPPAFVD
ncbi:MAG: hypothetical protein M3Z14_04345, partial [Candidatus Eremiobacteraeota bacterium]|nr:hypothetical protein [Candidatus Eremiobacteraeota bacterium]